MSRLSSITGSSPTTKPDDLPAFCAKMLEEFGEATRR